MQPASSCSQHLSLTRSSTPAQMGFWGMRMRKISMSPKTAYMALETENRPDMQMQAYQEAAGAAA